MSKPTEQRYPSGPTKVGEQKPVGKSNTQPYYKATTVLPQDGSQGAGKVVRQEQQKPAKEAAKAPPRQTKRDDNNQRQEPSKS